MSQAREQMLRLNRQIRQMDLVYHQLAVCFGLSDCAFWLLSVLLENEGAYSQRQLCEMWSFSKQTLNSAVAKLRRDGLIELTVDEHARNRKIMRLTPEGEAFAERTVRRVIVSEHRAAKLLGAAEMERYIELGADYMAHLQAQLEKELGKADLMKE